MQLRNFAARGQGEASVQLNIDTASKIRGCVYSVYCVRLLVFFLGITAGLIIVWHCRKWEAFHAIPGRLAEQVYKWM